MISLRSKVTRKLLAYFFLNPEEESYVNELARHLSLDPKNTHRKLCELESEGILRSTTRGNQRNFSLKPDFPFYQEYKKIILGTVGLENQLREALKDIAGIDEAYIFGSYAKNSMDSDSDVDILIIGSHSVRNIQRSINDIQSESGREINVINMSAEELESKREDSLVRDIFSGKTVKLI